MFSLILTLLTAQPCHRVSWQQALAEFKQARPAATAQDFYKLAHQGVMGSEHAVGTGDAARAWMQQELASLAPAPAGVVEPLVEPLPPDGRYVRVHLRPYLARGLSTDALVNAFIATANAGRGDSAQLVCALESLPGQERALFETQRAQGFGAVHHSAAYERAYGPAYRVLSAERASAIIARADTTR